MGSKVFMNNDDRKFLTFTYFIKNICLNCSITLEILFIPMFSNNTPRYLKFRYKIKLICIFYDSFHLSCVLLQFYDLKKNNSILEIMDTYILFEAPLK